MLAWWSCSAPECLVVRHRKGRLLVSRVALARTKCKVGGFRFPLGSLVCARGPVDKAVKRETNFRNFFTILEEPSSPLRLLLPQVTSNQCLDIRRDPMARFARRTH